jgi:AraC-like DNA-binding protein
MSRRAESLCPTRRNDRTGSVATILDPVFMARPSKEPPARSSLVPAIVREAAARGLDVEALAWRFGLPTGVSHLDEVSVGVDVPEGLLEAIARASGPDVALRVGCHLESRRQTLVELAVRASATVREALGALARWVPLLQEGFEASLHADDPGSVEASWVLRTPRRPRGMGRHVHELVLAHAVHQVRAGCPELGVARVWFSHARPADLSATSAFFGTDDLSFGAEDSGFAVDRASLEWPMLQRDPRTVATIAPLVDAELEARPRGSSFAERVSAHVAASLPGGADVTEVARAMHMGARTLQRRLEQEQTRFTEVLDRARLGVARRLLADRSISLTDVAFRLGFADLATFSRAFKRWTGVPPGQWRRS